MWFKKLVGFDEVSPENVRKNIYVAGDSLISKVNHRSMRFGCLDIPSLNELRYSISNIATSTPTSVREVVANVQDIHADYENGRAVFQAASQFNLLEMANPNVTPEAGVDIYFCDKTQGPACAIACGAGTIYRNYFVPVKGGIGQSKDRQIDCLENIGIALGNDDEKLWKMKNGYMLPTTDGLDKINDQLSKLKEEDLDAIRGLLKVGIQYNSEVTSVYNTKNCVTQIYCSALPVAYSGIDVSKFEIFGRLILEATYEATILAGIINKQNKGCNKIFITMVGGGVFGNPHSWIVDAIRRSVNIYKNYGLDISIVSYEKRNKNIESLLTNKKCRMPNEDLILLPD